MTARTYDLIVTVQDATDFNFQDVVYSTTSNAIGIIAGISNNSLKIRLAELDVKFTEGETIISHTSTIVEGDSISETQRPFTVSTLSGYTTKASSVITAVVPSPFIAEKNSFTQNPIVRLYTVYMPGNWYPESEDGYPAGDIPEFKGIDGLDASLLRRPWPNKFPLRFSEIVGDYIEELQYAVSSNGISYMPMPMNISGFDQGSDGKISDLSLTVFNADGIVTRLVEDPYLVGENEDYSTVYVDIDGKLVNNIDPRTIPTDPAYNSSIVDYYGKEYASFDYYQTTQTGSTWKSFVRDSRDLHGAVVEINTTFANFLDYWPEYSFITDYTQGDTSDKETGLSLTTSISSGDTFDSIYGTSNTVYAANLVFPVNPMDGLIWETGGQTYGSWLGIRESGTTLRLRGGDGSSAFSASDTGVAVLDISDFPKDGKEHTVVWQFDISSGSVKLWIDGILKGQATATDGAFSDDSYAGANIGSYLVNSASNTIGEEAEVSNFSGGDLRIYSNQLVTVGDEQSIVKVYSNLPYRPGDIVQIDNSTELAIVTYADGVNTLHINGQLNIIEGSHSGLYIVNNEADPESTLKDTFKIDQLESLSDYVATFGLVSWLQHFKAAIPRRRYLKNTCAWRYKSEECGYDPTAADSPGYFDATNEATTELQDVCSKSYAACKIRENQQNFGAFPGVGRTIPRG